MEAICGPLVDPLGSLPKGNNVPSWLCRPLVSETDWTFPRLELSATFFTSHQEERLMLEETAVVCLYRPFPLGVDGHMGE